MENQYFDPEHQKACELGFQDGLQGKLNTRKTEHRQQYLSGWKEGSQKRADNIFEMRKENAKKARGIKCQRIG